MLLLIRYLLGLLPLIRSTPNNSRVTNETVSSGGISLNASANITDLLTRWGVPGAVIAYVSPGKEEVVSFGQRDVLGGAVTNEVGGYPSEPFRAALVRTHEVELTRQTYFAIASNTKLFTAVALSLMIEDGTKLPNGQLLEVTSSMKDVVPGWAMENATAGNEITLRDVMCELFFSFTHIIPLIFHLVVMLDTKLTPQPCARVYPSTSSQ